MANCSTGIHLGKVDECHSKSFTRKYGIIKLFDLPETDHELLFWRTSFRKPDSTTILCLHHEKVFVGKYSFLQKVCCDPFSLHPEISKMKFLWTIDLQTADHINTITGKTIDPGQKFCVMCETQHSGLTTLHRGRIRHGCRCNGCILQWRPLWKSYKRDHMFIFPKSELRKW